MGNTASSALSLENEIEPASSKNKKNDNSIIEKPPLSPVVSTARKKRKRRRTKRQEEEDGGSQPNRKYAQVVASSPRKPLTIPHKRPYNEITKTNKNNAT